MNARVAEIDSRSPKQAYQRVFSWGANSYGQLAQGDTTDQVLPKETSVIDHKVVSITGGGGHTLVITESGQLLACGSNNCGQLGQDDLQDRPELRPVASLGHLRVTMVTGGWDFTLALTDEGQVYSWGSNAFGQLGRPDIKKCTNLPGEVEMVPASHICHLAAGMRHALAVTEQGKVLGWGWGKKGQLGVSVSGKPLTSSPVPVSVAVVEGIGPVRQAFAGSHHSGAVSDSGRVLVWGCNKWGQTTLNPQEVQQVPEPHAVSLELFGGEKVEKVASGWSHCVAKTESGNLLSWGRSDFGQLGHDASQPFDPLPSPVEIDGRVLSLQCGSEHCVILTAEGKVQMWGWNEHGTCGTGQTADVPRPHTVETLAGHGVAMVGTGAGHVLAVVNCQDEEKADESETS